MRSLLEAASDPGSQLKAALYAEIERRKGLLQRFCGAGEKSEPLRLTMQAGCLYGVQAYCNDHGWPKGMVARLFYQLYNKDVVDEDGFGVWREDTNDSTPGKDKALLQASEFLAWLDEAPAASW